MATIPTTSTTLLRDVASDSQHARWTEFAARYRPMMEAYLRERFPSVEADDVIQETLIAVCAALPSYRYAPDEKGHFHNYLTGILRNKALRQLGANRRYAEIAEKVREGVSSDGGAVAPRTPLEYVAAVPVLADLGLAKAIATSDVGRSASDVTIGGVGTPGYGAPEQMERGEATVASDIHAIGVLADRCFDGNPPKAWKRIIERATSSILGRRYQSVDEFLHAICRRNLWRNVGRFVLAFFLVGLVVDIVIAVIVI